MSAIKGCARYPTSVAEIRTALLSLAPSPSLGRVLSIAAAERLIAQATVARSAGKERPGTGGRPAQLVGAVDRYCAELTVPGRGKHKKLTITITRDKAVAGEATARRRPMKLQITLPKRDEHQSMTMYLPKDILVEERADGTYGLRVGTHEVKFAKFDQRIDVTITKIGEAAAPAPMEVDE